MKIITFFALLIAFTQALDVSKLNPPSIKLPKPYAGSIWEQIKRKLEIRTGNKAEDVASFPLMKKDSRIIGGSLARQGMFPWQAFLSIDQSVVCGGSLISGEWVMTAGHCSLEHSYFTVVLGAQNIRNTNEQGRQVFQTTQKYVHQGFNPQNLDNDITLLRLPRSAVPTNTVDTIGLPGYSWQNLDLTGYYVTISGWGRTSDGSPSISDELMYTSMPVMSDDQCAAVWGDLMNPSKVCTDTRGPHSTCNGDSGGPLIVQTTTGGYVQVGIVSFGSTQGCGLGYPAVFTRVTSFLQWIQSISGINIPPK